MSRKPEVIRAIHCMPRQRCEPQIRGGQGRFPALLRQDRAFPRGACVVDQFADLEKLEAALRSAEVSYDDESAAAGECHGAPLRASPRPRLRGLPAGPAEALIGAPLTADPRTFKFTFFFFFFFPELLRLGPLERAPPLPGSLIRTLPLPHVPTAWLRHCDTAFVLRSHCPQG